MRWIYSSVEFIEPIDAQALIKKVELACRNCYKSEDKITEGSGEKLIRNCLARHHESPMEHASVSFRVICDRGVSHELVRHRIAAYSQESSRYCNYSKGKFNSELTFIYPWWIDKVPKTIDTNTLGEEYKYYIYWKMLSMSAEYTENRYMELTKSGAEPDIARAILPNMIKTEVVCTMNMRELRHFIQLRASRAAHGDMYKIAKELYDKLIAAGLGIFFEDIEPYEK